MATSDDSGLVFQRATGEWLLTKEHAFYSGASHVGDRVGLAVSDMNMSGGSVRGTVTFDGSVPLNVRN